MLSKMRRTYFFCELLSLKVCHLDECALRQESQLSPEVNIPTEAQLLKKKKKTSQNINEAENIYTQVTS